MDALRRFEAAYADPDAVAAEARAAGRRVVRVWGVDAPRERLLDRGFQPVRLAPVTGATPRADEALGLKSLGPRGRGLLEAILSPAYPDVPILVTAADAEQAQVFAVVREMARTGGALPPPLHLLDLRHADREGTRTYNGARLAELDRWLDGLPDGTAPDPADAGEHLAALARALALRPRLSGAGALAIVGSASILPPAEHRALLTDLLDRADAAPGREGPRLFVCGSLHEDARAYAAIEGAGCAIVGEDHGWGAPYADPARRLPVSALPVAEAAARAAQAVAALRPTHVLHLTLPGDETAPWQVAALGRALLPHTPLRALRVRTDLDGLTQAVADFLAGVETLAPPRSPRPPAAARPPETRSRKSLSSVAGFNSYQRDWFADVRARVADGEPFAVVNANAPQEMLRALGISFVVNQWWASIVAAKQQTRRYAGLLRARDLPADVEPYSAQGLAAAFDDDPNEAPWGGLPRPRFVHAIASTDATPGVFGNWAEATGAELYLYERTVDPRPDLPLRWWEELPDDWDRLLEPARLDLLEGEIREVVARLEAATGRRFDPDRFAEVMHLVNEQEDWYRRTRDLIARTTPAPIGVVDQMPATMVPQWHRGTVWARDAARAFHDEVAARAAAGLGAVTDERVRLMWVGRGLWSEMGFYQRWEESHGAVFVWSMYLGLAADGYIRRFDRGRDPVRALAARFLTMGDELRMPSWAAPWHVHEAETHRVDGAVAVSDADPFVLRALARADVPVLDLGVDNFDRDPAAEDALHARVTAFIEGPAGIKAKARRGG